MLKKLISVITVMSMLSGLSVAFADNTENTPIPTDEINSPAPEVSLIPENTPASTKTPTPTKTPKPTATPKPTKTPAPTKTPKPTKTPAPTKTPKPTATPKPTKTPAPTKTPKPTATPKPTKTPAPTKTPKPTSTPQPTKTPGPPAASEDFIITQSGTYDIDKTDSKYCVIVEDGVKDVIINLSDSSIKSSSPVKLGKDTSVTINVSGTNIIEPTSENPAIFVPETASVTISGSGSLKVSSSGNAAAIGSDNSCNAGTINITGADITAKSENKGAAIGGGSGKKASEINISGGNITAEANDAPAIGGGANAQSVKINITGGTIKAVCGDGNAAIGGGYRASGGEINVTGGTIYAEAGSFGRIIGGGRYSTDSKVNISGSADVFGVVKKGACAVDENEIKGNMPMICAYYRYDDEDDEFDGKQTITINGPHSRTITLPDEYAGFFTILGGSGEYTLKKENDETIQHFVPSSSSSSSSSYTSSSKKTDRFTISNGLNHFELYPSDNCYLDELNFSNSVTDILLTETQTKKTTNLSASTKKLPTGSCSIHKSNSIKYSYEIIEDPSNIAELNDKKLTVDVKYSGTYYVTVKVTAECGDLTTEKTQVINVVKQGAAHDMSKDDLNITSNGTYTVKSSSTRYNINVASGLDDVNIIFPTALNLDMSKDTTLRKSPITIGDNSNVTITRTNTLTLKSTDSGSCIELGKNSQLFFKGNSTVKLENYGTSSCISGESGTSVYLLDGKFETFSEDGNLIKADKLFISDKTEFTGWCENNKSYPLNAKYITENYQSYKPAYVIQGKLSNSVGTDNSSIEIKNTTQSATKAISDLSKDCSAFAVKMNKYGNFKVSLREGKSSVYNEYTIKDGSRKVSEVSLLEEQVYIASNEYTYNNCKCKLSAPSFSMEKVTLDSDRRTASYSLDADGAKLTLDNDCKIHDKNTAVHYRYYIEEDKSKIAQISDSNRLIFNVDNPGKYTVKVTAEATAGGLESSKTATISVTKLSDAETNKQRGELHEGYINGYDDGKFRPDNNITRAEAAAILVSALDYDYSDDDTSFYDVNQREWYYDAVVSVESEKIFSGYGDGSFKPDNYITRAEFTVAVCNAFSIAKSSQSSKSKMSDVNEHWSKGYVDALIKTKYITGYEDGTFKPDNYITRAEAVAILNRALGRNVNETKMQSISISNPFTDVKKSHWAYYNIMEAVEDHYANEWHK